MDNIKHLSIYAFNAVKNDFECRICAFFIAGMVLYSAVLKLAFLTM